jgi:hypothetical protein
MSVLFAGFARSYRLGRAVGAALFLLIALLWLSWARSHPPTSRDRTTATITKIVDLPIGADSDCVALIRLDDGRDGRLVVPRYAAVDGGRVPLIVETYPDGDTYLVFDVEKWVDVAAGR